MKNISGPESKNLIQLAEAGSREEHMKPVKFQRPNLNTSPKKKMRPRPQFQSMNIKGFKDLLATVMKETEYEPSVAKESIYKVQSDVVSQQSEIMEAYK